MLQTNSGHLQGFLWVIFSEPREFRLPDIDSLPLVKPNIQGI